MISTLFTQFRHQYANGGLTTELLTTHAEQYLVKATVTIGEQTVATAMAADSNLAAADDQAKVRVLAMLGFDQSTEMVPQKPATPAFETEQPTAKTESASPAVPESAINSAVAEALEVEPMLDGPSETDEDDMGRPIDSIMPDEAPAPSEVPPSSLAAAAIQNFDDSNPVDLSDIIAQTDVEMARLGWSNVQGRQHLEKTFNKRSRQQLTDEELLTFLLYLESQPTPSMS